MNESARDSFGLTTQANPTDSATEMQVDNFDAEVDDLERVVVLPDRPASKESSVMQGLDMGGSHVDGEGVGAHSVSEKFPSVRETPKQNAAELPEATGTKFPNTDPGRAYPKPGSSDGSYSDESWAYKAHSSQIRYLPLENTKMEAILDRVQKKIHWGVREACSVIGLLFFTIGILIVECARMLAYTLLRPWLHLMRFIIHLVSNLFCDVCYICSLGCRRTCLPITDACATWSHEVTVPVIKQFRPVRLYQSQTNQRTWSRMPQNL
ncbi:hypothetical protein CRM22_005152 [Opisthorchis felineus]|uniref:Caveolin n=1 Tax=Opisthorchis felineus TaxID=147828 RepID=A0A4S2LTS1_OPIFE|nr:hypothetical protein CRM22_005152 [Opisthorchis felineus]